MISSSSCRSASGPSSCIIDHRPQPVIQRRQQPLGDRPDVQGPAPPSPPAPAATPGAVCRNAASTDNQNRCGSRSPRPAGTHATRSDSPAAPRLADPGSQQRRLPAARRRRRWPGRSAARCGRAWCATCSAAPTWGIPLPPMLTDLPIGAWVTSAPLDAAGGPAAEEAADLLVTAGVVAGVPTAAAGLNDWSDTAGPETRVGLVHAAVNTTALSLYLASVVAGARDDGAAARRWAWPGWGAAGRRVPGRAPVLRPGRGGQPHRVGAADAAVRGGRLHPRRREQGGRAGASGMPGPGRAPRPPPSAITTSSGGCGSVI